MCHLELNDEEHRILQEVLESDLSDLRMEISETDSRTFKEQLKNKAQVMTNILTALQQTQEPDAVSD